MALLSTSLLPAFNLDLLSHGVSAQVAASLPAIVAVAGGLLGVLFVWRFVRMIVMADADPFDDYFDDDFDFEANGFEVYDGTVEPSFENGYHGVEYEDMSDEQLSSLCEWGDEGALAEGDARWGDEGDGG